MNGIENSKADIIAIAETWLDDSKAEFKVKGYEMAANIVRKKGAGGLLLLVKKGIGIEIKDAVSVLPEVHLITYAINGFTYIAIYRSPSYSTKKENDQHNILIQYLNKTINKLGGDPYILYGDLNLAKLAKDNFRNENTRDDIDDGYDSDTESSKPYTQQWIDFVGQHE
ncbi:MAG: hypothetical protein GY705_31540, partial [Bacteroidetes bacterium]|nr:hypothetical protein [Bacteroidota bacterium]